MFGRDMMSCIKTLNAVMEYNIKVVLLENWKNLKISKLSYLLLHDDEVMDDDGII